MSYHGGDKGCFKVLSEERDGGGYAFIMEATDNEIGLPDEWDGCERWEVCSRTCHLQVASIC